MTRTTGDDGPGGAAAANEAALRELLLRGLGGDAAAYHRFLQRLAVHLRAFLARRLYGWPDDVEDLVQECLLAMHHKRHTYQTDQPLTAWVHAIARYKLVDLLRAKGAREALNDPLDDELAVFTASAVDASDARRDLDTLLAALPERQRLAIVHVKVNGQSVAETAAALRMTVAAVKVSVHRGLKALELRHRGTR